MVPKFFWQKDGVVCWLTSNIYDYKAPTCCCNGSRSRSRNKSRWNRQEEKFIWLRASQQGRREPQGLARKNQLASCTFGRAKLEDARQSFPLQLRTCCCCCCCTARRELVGMVRGSHAPVRPAGRVIRTYKIRCTSHVYPMVLAAKCWTRSRIGSIDQTSKFWCTGLHTYQMQSTRNHIRAGTPK